MSDSYIDHLPSHEREKIRKRLRSPEEYERLREKVKGPQDLEREMERNAEFAEARLHLESDRNAQERAKDAVKAFVQEQGIESAFDSVPAHMAEALKKGAFEVKIDVNRKEPRLAVTMKQSTEAPMGNVSEAVPLSQKLQQQILSTFKLK